MKMRWGEEDRGRMEIEETRDGEEDERGWRMLVFMEISRRKEKNIGGGDIEETRGMREQ